MPKRTRMHRRAEKRARVERAERVRPTPETLAKLRPWPMQALLAAGRHDGGIDADDFEMALQIVETFKILTSQVGLRGFAQSPDSMITKQFGGLYMSDHDAERCAQWFAWSARLPRGLPVRLVAWIEDDAPIGSVEVLRRACRLWERIGNDRRKASRNEPIDGVLVHRGLDLTPSVVLTMAPREICQNHRPIDANLENLTVQRYPASAGTLAHAERSNPFAGHASGSSTAVPRLSQVGHDAVTPARSSAVRTR